MTPSAPLKTTTHLAKTILLVSLLAVANSAFALVSLKNLNVELPPNLSSYVINPTAAKQLGKALFWDMQVGSDGVQACASCHHHAGADSRVINTLNPGQAGGDNTFGNNNLGLPQLAPGTMAPNKTLTPVDFPFHRLGNQDFSGEKGHNEANVVSDTNDVVGSMGMLPTQFVDIIPGSPVDNGTQVTNATFMANGTQYRQVTGRNTPSVVNAVLNFTNFWDGRANNIFNGNNPFGPADPRAHLLSNSTGSLVPEEVRMRQASPASQAVGPPLSDVEMSYAGRTWPKIGKKMLSLKPLGQQAVSGSDSLLGGIADTGAGTGLTVTYEQLIQAAFAPRYWNNTSQKITYDASGNPVFQAGTPLNTDEYTQMEANFSFFFGVAVQMYESTLIADDSAFDKFLEGNGPQSVQEARGQTIFQGVGGCLACHGGTAATIDHEILAIQGVDPITGTPIPLDQNPLVANELMQVAGVGALYDNGFHNTGVRPGGNTIPGTVGYLAVNEDVGRGGMTGLGGTFTDIPLSFSILGLLEGGFPVPQMPTLTGLPAHMAGWVPPLPPAIDPNVDTQPPGRVSNFGAFKTPGLRNIELTGPYMHNGGLSTLRQTVDFYVRGGDFFHTNLQNFDPGVQPLPDLRDTAPLGTRKKDDLVAFMRSLTDHRTKEESAPFDHPELFVAVKGDAPVSPGHRAGLLADTTNFKRIPAVGAAGRTVIFGLPNVGTFLDLDPFDQAVITDTDKDGVADVAGTGYPADNCPVNANPGQQDGDADTIGNACDVCSVVANTDQRDTNGDGYGNICDADLDDDGSITLSDFYAFSNEFNKAAPGTGTMTDHADFNGDNKVTLADFFVLSNSFGGEPGPSGLHPVP
ncbi:MAG: cytochrome c peroxidase [Gammaproteobacteria bacterium]